MVTKIQERISRKGHVAEDKMLQKTEYPDQPLPPLYRCSEVKMSTKTVVYSSYLIFSLGTCNFLTTAWLNKYYLMRLEHTVSPEVKQQRQTKYREELQAQMKEREMQKKRCVPHAQPPDVITGVSMKTRLNADCKNSWQISLDFVFLTVVFSDIKTGGMKDSFC